MIVRVYRSCRRSDNIIIIAFYTAQYARARRSWLISIDRIFCFCFFFTTVFLCPRRCIYVYKIYRVQVSRASYLICLSDQNNARGTIYWIIVHILRRKTNISVIRRYGDDDDVKFFSFPFKVCNSRIRMQLTYLVNGLFFFFRFWTKPTLFRIRPRVQRSIVARDFKTITRL